MKWDVLYYSFDFLFYLAMGVSGILKPEQVLHLFKVPEAAQENAVIDQFITSLGALYANVLAVINLAQCVSFMLALAGNEETKKTVCRINAFLNLSLVACWWYHIHFTLNNPTGDMVDHMLFTERGIAGIWFGNMWIVADAVILSFFGVYRPYAAQLAAAAAAEAEKNKNKKKK